MNSSPSFSAPPRSVRAALRHGVLASLLTLVVAFAAEAAKREFDIPAGTAEKNLKLFSRQANVEVIFSTKIADGVRTHAVQGEMTPSEALDAMLARTGLVVVRDAKTGAFSIRKEVPPPKADRVPPPPRRPVEAKAAGPNSPHDILTLSPFEVGAAGETGYASATALTGTLTNEKLANLPNSISVITSELMSDLALTDFYGAVDFGVGVENIYNSTAVVGAPVGASQSNQVSIRGVASVRQLRDGFVWFAPQDAYNIDRIEFNRGPGGTAYGDVDPIGVLNIVTKRAVYRRFAIATARLDDFGTRRFTLDLNQPLAGRVSVRLNAVNSNVEKSRQRADTTQRAYAGAVRWQPFPDRATQLDLRFETGHYRLNQAALALDDGYSAYAPGSGTNATDANPAVAGVQVNGVGLRQIAPATGNARVLLDLGGTLYDLKSTATVTYRNSAILTGANVATGADPQNPARLGLHHVPFSLIPYGQDWGGPFNYVATNYRAYSLELTRRIGPALNLLLAHNAQVIASGQASTFSASAVLGMNSRTLFIDVNRFLPDPNNAGRTMPNPRFEQFFVGHLPVWQTNGSTGSGWRASAVYDAALPFDSTLRAVAGANYRHVQRYANRFGYSLTLQEMARRGIAGTAATYPNNIVYPIHYIADGNSDEALRLKTIPGVETWFRTSVGNNSRFDQTLGAGSLNLLGSFLKGRLHVSGGVNREYFRQNRARPAVANASGELQFVDLANKVVPHDGPYDIPYARFSRAYATNSSYGAVLRLTPWMAASAGYFESALFSESLTSDLAGNPALPLKGTGQDYSVRLNLLDDRIEATITRFDTVAANNVLNILASSSVELNALLPPGRDIVGTGDYRDQTTRGWEIEAHANLSPHWALRATYATSRTAYTRFYPLLRPYLEEARAIASASGTDPDGATAQTARMIASTEGSVTFLRRETASLIARYRFGEGAAKGLTLGGSVRYVLGHPLAAQISGGQVAFPESATGNYVLLNPFAAYRRKVWGRAVSIQLNVDNALNRRSQQTLTVAQHPYFTEPRQITTTVTVAY